MARTSLRSSYSKASKIVWIFPDETKQDFQECLLFSKIGSGHHARKD